ncbi:MAG: T9SS type A sorting domain-containing protein [Candidatus Cloacimonadota bacterium]|nr:T9SS type A sorting domain-containing protein [Candidatus Cloacimonadota bacterium]
MKIKIFILTLLLIFVNQFLYADPPNWEHIYGTQYSMVLMAEVTFDGEVFEGTGNNMAGAFCFTDSLECRSVATWQEPNPPHWEGYWHFVIVANENGEEISFKIYDDSTDVIYNCNQTIFFEDNTTIGNPGEPFMLTSPLSVDAPNHILTFHLNQNIPNPFNATTYISFSLPKSCNVKIQIYNVKGQLVTTLIDEYKPAGYHSADWNVKDMSSGIYFYKLHTDTFISIKKCIILK